MFESAGQLTQRTAEREDEVEGFQFSLGHGVGLQVHEAPPLGLAGRDALVAGDENETRPHRGQPLGRDPSDPGGRPGDHHHLATHGAFLRRNRKITQDT